ncbi:MAG: hypothetical protein OEM76_13705 [Gammaproteobacteria bacterium]|nr:hypothetical protein [Gammaproteobacteria bacterium]
MSSVRTIPIREKDSLKAPFDLDNQRMVLVKRNQEGEADIKAFKADLMAKIASLLEAEVICSPDASAPEE